MNSHITATFHALHCKRCSSGHPFYGQFDFGTFDLYVCSHLTLGTRLRLGEGGALDVGQQIFLYCTKSIFGSASQVVLSSTFMKNSRKIYYNALPDSFDIDDQHSSVSISLSKARKASSSSVSCQKVM